MTILDGVMVVLALAVIYCLYVICKGGTKPTPTPTPTRMPTRESAWLDTSGRRH